MKKRPFRIVVIALVGCALAVAGCETAGGSAGLGAGLGALAGGVIGNQSGHALEGAAIGALVGAAAGFIVHDVKARRARSAQETYQDYKYEPQQGFKMDMKGGSVAPGTVKAGQSVTTTMQYAVLGAGNSGVDVHETCVLQKSGSNLAELENKTVNRQDGTWENLIEFEVPKNAEAGNYTVAQGVKASGQSFQKEMTFNVATANACVEDVNTLAMASAR